MDGDAQAVEAVHVLGPAFVPDLRRYRPAGFKHGHQTVSGGEEFGQLDGDQVTADDDDAVAQRHPGPGRHPDRGGSHQPLTPTAHQPGEKFAQRRTVAHVRQLGTGDARQYDPAAGGHHHRVGAQVDDVVERNFVAQYDLRGAAADLATQVGQEGLVLGMHIDAHSSAPPS